MLQPFFSVVSDSTSPEAKRSQRQQKQAGRSRKRDVTQYPRALKALTNEERTRPDSVGSGDPPGSGPTAEHPDSDCD